MHNDNKKSKIRNNPVRTIVIEDDNRPGSYPTHIPPGSTLVDPIYFDDTDTIETPSAYSQVRFRITDRRASSIGLRFEGSGGVPFAGILRIDLVTIPAEDVPASNQFYISIGDLRTEFEKETGDPVLIDDKEYIKRVSLKIVKKINSLSLPLDASFGNADLITVRYTLPGSLVGEFYTTIAASSSPIVTDKGERVGNVSATYADFDLGSDSNIYAPLGVNLDNARTQGLVERQYILPAVLTGSIQVPTSGDARLLEVYSKGHPVYKGPNSIAPYNEDNAGQAFGFGDRANDLQYGTDASGGSEFMLRGSTSGSLDESLANKDKIVIDLEPVGKTTIQFDAEKTTRDNYPMMYFNHELKVWEPIGLNLDVSAATPGDIDDELNRLMIGFSQGYNNVAQISTAKDVQIVDPALASQFTGTKLMFTETGWCSPTDTFGFPSHPKFAATGSQGLSVDTLIDRPFLIEKMVYEFSGSFSTEWIPPATPYINTWDFIPALAGYELRIAGSTFFMLNQRKANPRQKKTDNFASSDNASNPTAPGLSSLDPNLQERVEYSYGGPPTTIQLSDGGPLIYVDTVREMINFSRVGVIPEDYDDVVVDALEPGFPHPADFMELAIKGPEKFTGFGERLFSGKFTLTDSIKNGVPSPSLHEWPLESHVFGVSPSSLYVSRNNSQDSPTGRAYRAEFAGQQTSYTALPTDVGSSPPQRVYAPVFDFYESPYIIRPGDNLIFGWQSILSDRSGVEAPDFTIAPGAGKLILYGSYLQDEKPVHDIYKDQLSSDAAHEAIPAGPWVLDRFESEPSMVYTGSMRAQLVTGTMVTRGATGSLNVTDLNDLSIGGVRAVAATSYDGNLKQRGSFYRNLRLADSEEQYYDSMQPNPLEVIFRDGGLIFSLSDNKSSALIRLPGEVFSTTSPATDTLYNQYSNEDFFGTFLFNKFSEVPRVKSINSKILTANPVQGFDTSLTQGEYVYNGGISILTGTDGSSDFSNLIAAGGISKSSLFDVKESPGGGLPLTNPYRIEIVSDEDLDTNPVLASGDDKTEFLGNRIATPKVDQIQAGFGSINFHLSRFVGCFGDGFLGLIQFQKYFDANTLGFPVDKFSMRGMVYRGARYGLINPTPLFSDAIYNGTSYGQPRDLMEPRKYSRFSLADNTLTDSAVNVVFVDNTVVELTDGARNNVTSGSATNSINISPFCTSSLPFVDGQVKDRSLPLPEDLLRL